MKYLKRFESRDVLKGKDRTKIEEDIKGILVELSDKNISYRINWVGNWTNGLIIYLDKDLESGLRRAVFNQERMNSKDYVFNTSDIKDYLLTIEDYFREYWGDINLRYDLKKLDFGIEDITSYGTLDDNIIVAKITMEIKRS